MRAIRLPLVLVGVGQLILAVGFFFQQAWATSLWPVPDTRLSYAFIAAILAGGAAKSLLCFSRTATRRMTRMESTTGSMSWVFMEFSSLLLLLSFESDA